MAHLLVFYSCTLSNCCGYSLQQQQQHLSASAHETTQTTIRLRGRVAYHGAAFCGFQLQKGRHEHRSVQGVLENVLHQRLLGYRDVIHGGNNENREEQKRILKVVGAGRTDAGVHARGQAFHVDVPASCIERLLERQHGSSPAPDAPNDFTGTRTAMQQLSTSLNRMLPEDCVVWNVGLAPAPIRKTVPQTNTTKLYDWNVMYDTTGKLYRYRLSVAPVMDPIERHIRWRPPMDHREWHWHNFDACLQLFVGTHDFAAFTAAHPPHMSSVRTVYSIQVTSNPTSGAVDIDFHLQGALYKQVRNMVGSAVAVATGSMTVAQVQDLLEPGKRRADNPSAPAPPEGLTLEQVYFDAEDDDDDDPF